jgi:predicted tellurium resistance membrane protein TerC
MPNVLIIVVVVRVAGFLCTPAGQVRVLAGDNHAIAALAAKRQGQQTTRAALFGLMGAVITVFGAAAE